MPEVEQYPEYVSRFYDTVYLNLLQGVDLDYYLKRISEISGPVLELGTGTGRIFIKALENGADIYGVDVSKNMIEVLKKKIPNKFHDRLQVQDARNLKLTKKFDLVIAPFRMFSHLIRVEDQIKTLNGITNHLNPDGRLIFDVYVPNLEIIINGLENHLDFDGEYENGKFLKRYISTKTDAVNQITQVKMTFIWMENGKTIKKDWNFQMRFFYRYELEHLVFRSQLELVNIYGDFSENPLNSDSKEFVIVCKKP
jgi:SAM-dependent methyltransferase